MHTRKYAGSVCVFNPSIKLCVHNKCTYISIDFSGELGHPAVPKNLVHGERGKTSQSKGVTTASTARSNTAL